VEVSGIGLVGSIATVLFVLAFAGIVVWAWSSRQRESFDAAARLPLEEDKETRP
jgi:cytochrome c oxidase cbb3-type subunit IV